MSFQDGQPIITRMPQSELRAVLIKEQHHMESNRIEYARLKLPRITHEYVVLWQKEAITPRNLS